MDQPSQKPPGAPPADQEAAAMKLQSLLAQVWKKSEATLLDRIDTIRAAEVAMRESSLQPDRREAAHAAAHKLAGVLGTFGLHRGSELAHRAELLLNAGEPASPQEAATLAEVLQELDAIIQVKSKEVA